MADSQRSRAVVWLAASSALLVLAAGGVAVSRVGRTDHATRVASAPEASPSTQFGSGPAGGASPASGGGATTASAATQGGTTPSATGPESGVAGTASSGAGSARSAAASAGNAGTAGSQRSGSKPSGAGSSGSGAGSAGSGAGQAASNPPAPGSPAGGSSGSPSAGGQGGGQASPPGSGQAPPEQAPLVGVSVSAGQGATGGVVGAGVDNSRPAPDANVTIGTNPVVGSHPPSSGTGISFNGRFFHPPPSVPVLPG